MSSESKCSQCGGTDLRHLDRFSRPANSTSVQLIAKFLTLSTGDGLR